jgi:hypothetical protein
MDAQIGREAGALPAGVSCVGCSRGKERDAALSLRQLRDSGWLPIDRQRLTTANVQHNQQKFQAMPTTATWGRCDSIMSHKLAGVGRA